MNLIPLLPALGCFFVLNASGAAALEITDATQKNLQRYLNWMSEEQDGTFAVSADGSFSHYAYCKKGACSSNEFESEVLRICSDQYHQTCSVLASGRSFKTEFTVVPGWVSPSNEIRAGLLNADQLKQAIIGNTMQGEYLNAVTWAEYFDPSGEIVGRDDQQGAYRAHWKIVGRELCFDYANFTDWCAEVSANGDRIALLNEGNVQNLTRNIKLHPGKIDGL